MCEDQNPELTVDETGFTMLEKVALSNALRMLKRRFHKHALQMHIDFFTENEELIYGFRYNRKINLKALSKHPLAVMRFYERVIGIGIHDPSNFGLLLQTATEVHKNCTVTKYDIGLFAEAVSEHFKKTLATNSSPTLDNALDKLAKIITENYNAFARPST